MKDFVGQAPLYSAEWNTTEDGAKVNDDRDFDMMSPYERRAWSLSVQHLNDPPRSLPVPKVARELARATSDRAMAFADAHLPMETVKSIVEKAMDGALDLTFKPALRSANVDRVLSAFQAKHADLHSLDDLRNLDLQVVDGFRRRKGLYVSASAMQGAATSVAVTGTEVSTTVSGGATAGTVIAAVATDTIASLAMMGRSVGAVAVRYGYDIKLPDEEVFAMGLLSLGTAGTLEAKHAALAALSRLSQQMMRGAAWRQLNEHLLVRVIARMYEALGLVITRQKLAQTVPFVGIAINASLNANLINRVYQRAEDVYRLRFLSEKYDIDPQRWVREGGPEIIAPEGAAALPDVTAILEEEERRLEE